MQNMKNKSQLKTIRQLKEDALAQCEIYARVEWREDDEKMAQIPTA
jgi:hypothetical protein